MNKTNIEFINHASVVVSYKKISILSDPWYSGTAFHDGWKLIHELNENEIIKVLEKITHIYISHEHPDHFRPDFFSNQKIKKIILDKKIEFLFQNTKDKRIVNFLKKHGFEVIELNSNKKLKLSDNFEIQIVKSSFYDSAIIMKTPDIKILNLNDCPIRNRDELIKFKKNYGTFDVLLTQFSYAAWKGGIKNKIYREISAKEKMETIKRQATILECKSIIPFASFIYFSNELNFYMNDSINTPKKVTEFLAKKKFDVIFLSPGEVQNMASLKQNELSLNFWEQKYNDIQTKYSNNKIKYNESILAENLQTQFTEYKNKIFKKNSKSLILFLHKVKILNIFQPLKVKLFDHNKIYTYSILDGLSEISLNNKFDIQMHSQSLSFIFKNEFGFDTLTVNGCFETNQEGFMKSSKALAIGSLNAMGFNLNLNLFFQPKIILLFLNTLRKISKKLII